MGCSASRLSSTRSGTVSPAFFVARFLCGVLLAAGIAGLSLAAPVPPLALLGGKKRVAGLRYGGRENVLTADIDALADGAAECPIQLYRIALRKLFDRANPQKLKIANHGWPD